VAGGERGAGSKAEGRREAGRRGDANRGKRGKLLKKTDIYPVFDLKCTGNMLMYRRKSLFEAPF